jgi:hypothetical protein
MFLLIRWLRSGRGGLAARVGAVFLLLVLIALPVARVAIYGWSGFGLIPVVIIVALVAWRISAAARRRRAWPTLGAGPASRERMAGRGGGGVAEGPGKSASAPEDRPSA